MKRASIGHVVAAALAVALAVGVSVAAARPANLRALLCKSTISKGVVHYCGSASARLSIFPGVTFKNGTCTRQTLKSGPLLSLGVGARSQNAATNSGLAYLGLTVSGPLSKPTGGGVIAYYKSKRWGGKGIAFKASASGGTFVVRGINGSTGTASGNFHC
ncbi:MAG: hypothetical protein ABI948_05620 [Thermoleophilia bacterium]